MRMVCAALLFLAVAVKSIAQAPAAYSWPAVSAIGPVRDPLVLTFLESKTIGSWTIAWTVAGSPKQCSFYIQDGFDGINWRITGPFNKIQHRDSLNRQDCRASGSVSMSWSPGPHIRIVLDKWQGDPSSAINFSWAEVQR